jgi:ribonucleoside-diphosphate reductase alpha chain
MPEVRPREFLSDSVWHYVTSLKTVQKRSGEEQAFDEQKLRHSIEGVMRETGMEKDVARMERIFSQTLSQLSRIYNGHRTPSTSDIREVVAMTFIDHNLVHVARKYMIWKQALAPRIGREPVFGKGLRLSRYFTKEGVHPYDEITWEMRTAKITNEKGEAIFEQSDIETPAFWSQTATNIVAQKYFRGKVGQPERESSMKQLVSRVAATITNWGRTEGYFYSEHDAEIYEDELTHLLIHQKAAFNSPVWFNVGVNPHPQCSACFINSVEDDMRSIMHLATTESMLFKGGSGTGSNLSKLRSSKEYLSKSNGKSSGPVSFMKGFDAFAGVVKSGGKTRRAAKMVILNIDHPDIEEFILCKVKEERKAWALVDAGFDGSMDGDAYGSVFFQNANNSVRVNDDFMKAVEADGEWVTKEVTSGKDSVRFRARDLFRKMADAAWQCGDPGIQYDTTVNAWHTCKASGRINGSNPCSEYMFLDDSACNLASLNLMQYRVEKNGKMEFDIEAFRRAVDVIILAEEVIVGSSSYPTPAIEQNSLDYRALGIGYANLGAFLMSRGLAYDSDAGRNMAAAITAILTGESYAESARIAEKVGTFAGYEPNKTSMTEVIEMHRNASLKIHTEGVPQELLYAARKSWDDAAALGKAHGYRNAQVSVLAPTGTIAFLMDCDTTGVEPDIALVKYKWLVGGGMIKIVNQSIPEALDRLGYSAMDREAILKYINETDTIEGAPKLLPEHVSVFDCAFKAKNGTRTIHYMGHLRMMAAVQPFITGAISKTVNMPHEATAEEVETVYLEGWKMGLKAIAIYRDGSKRQQALTTSKKNDGHEEKKKNVPEEVAKPMGVPVATVGTPDFAPRRRRLPDERRSVTHRFKIGNQKGYMTVGLYDDNTPGELFITMAKEGSVVSGLMGAFATSISMALQYGVPLPVLVNKFVHTRFEPSGFTNNPNIRVAKSIVDYIFRWMGMKFLTIEDQRKIGINNLDSGVSHEIASEPVAAPQPDLFKVTSPAKVTPTHTTTFDNTSDAPACDTCGSIMVRNGACYKCLNCGGTSGCS